MVSLLLFKRETFIGKNEKGKYLSSVLLCFSLPIEQHLGTLLSYTVSVCTPAGVKCRWCDASVSGVAFVLPVS